MIGFLDDFVGKMPEKVGVEDLLTESDSGIRIKIEGAELSSKGM